MNASFDTWRSANAIDLVPCIHRNAKRKKESEIFISIDVENTCQQRLPFFLPGSDIVQDFPEVGMCSPDSPFIHDLLEM